MTETQPEKPRRVDSADLVGMAGLLLIIAGAWMAWHPAGPMLAGGAMLSYAWVKAKA